MSIIKIVTNNDLGTGVEIVANKLRAKVDGTSIQVNGSGALETVQSPTIVTDLVTLSGIAANSANLGTFTGATIPDAQTVKSALQALETALETLNISGQFAGSAATFATLPTTTVDGKAVNNGDWAILTTDDGANQSGVWLYNGTAYVLAKEIPEVFSLTVTSTDSNSIDFSGVGTVGSPLTASIKVDALAGNLLAVTASGVKVDPASVKAALTFDNELQDLASNTLGYFNSTVNFA
jgi:hypothetical protein